MHTGVVSLVRRFGFLLFGSVLACSACSSEKPNQQATPPSNPAAVGATEPGGMHSGSEWPSYNGGYDATRYSSLSRINTGNVASLTEVARFKLPETTAFQSGPVLVDGTMYVTTANNTYAFDPRTGEQRWIQRFDPKSAGIGTPVRGVGYADGRLFRGTPDGHLLALDAKTGVVIWDVVGADATIGEYYTAAPVVWEGRVYMANSGSDVGAIGHIRAFDTQTGKQLWNFDVVPSTGPGSETWKEAEHEREPRVSVSRSIFALVDDRDRAYFGRDGRDQDQVGYIDANTRAIFGRSYAAEPDVLVKELAADEAVAAADTLLLTVPNTLGVDYNAHVLESVLKHVAPSLGWR